MTSFHDELVVPDGDVFVHAGDLCRGGDLGELKVAADWIRSLPHTFKVVVAGNHDWAFVNSPSDARDLFGGLIYLQDERADVGGLSIYGSPWQPEYGGWAFNLPRGQKLREVWENIPAGLDVLVTHAPPCGLGDNTHSLYAADLAAARAGCSDLRAVVESREPRLHLFGHIHQDGGVFRSGRTVFANVTTWECERAATVIDIEPSSDLPVGPVVVPPHGRPG